MAFTPIPKGSENWDVPVNDAFASQDQRITSNADQLDILGPAVSQNSSDISNLIGRTSGENFYWLVASSAASDAVKAKADFICDGVNDQDQINAALTAAYGNSGGTVQLSVGKFAISASISIPPGVSLVGAHGDNIINPGQYSPESWIEPVAGFTGTTAIIILDQGSGGFSALSAEQQIRRLTIDGSVSDPGIHGIESTGYVHGVLLEDVCIRKVTGKGIYTYPSGNQPFSWTFDRVVVDNSGDVGIDITGMSDAQFSNVTVIGAGADGYSLSNMPNSRMVGCRAEWSDGNGYHITGAWGSGVGSGGITMSACTTDRNALNGILVDSTGNGPIMIQDVLVRRDGRNNGTGGGGYAGINVDSATNPVIITSVATYPGVDDNGTGTNSPQYGVSFTDAEYVSVSSGFLHANTNGWHDGGGNTIVRRGPNIGERTGSTNAPVNAFAEPWATAGNTTMAGYTVIDGGQSNGTWTTWDGSPSAFRIGSAGGGLAVAEGANGRQGIATLVAGTVTVANTSITANSRIQLTYQSVGGTQGFLRATKTAGTSFTITSSSNTDTSTVAYFITEPA